MAHNLLSRLCGVPPMELVQTGPRGAVWCLMRPAAVNRLAVVLHVTRSHIMSERPSPAKYGKDSTQRDTLSPHQRLPMPRHATPTTKTSTGEQFAVRGAQKNERGTAVKKSKDRGKKTAHNLERRKHVFNGCCFSHNLIIEVEQWVTNKSHIIYRARRRKKIKMKQTMAIHTKKKEHSRYQHANHLVSPVVATKQ